MSKREPGLEGGWPRHGVVVGAAALAAVLLGLGARSALALTLGGDRPFWSSADGLDPFNLVLYLWDHPAFFLVGGALLGAAYLALFQGVPSLGLARGRAGAAVLDEELSTKRLAALDRIRAADPLFSEREFLERAVKAFAALADGWTSRDMSRARAFVSDGVFERFGRQMAEHAERGVRRRLAGVDLRPPEVLGYCAGESWDSVHVAFRGSLVDELVALDGGGRVSGGTRELDEVWSFVRRPGAKTLGRPGPVEGHCPSCGAALEIVDAARCAACRSWVNSGEFDWVLSDVTRFDAWEYPDPDREVGGWRDLRAADPGLSLEALEDRGAVVFWRWLDAKRLSDPGPLSAVAADEFLAGFAPDGSWERDVDLAGVEASAVQRGAEYDRVHLQVSWEAERARGRGAGAEVSDRRPETFFFILHRKSGAQSDPKAGLTTARCPACGAPPSAADAPACAYCGRRLNDGALSWVLAEVVPFGRWRRPES